VAERFDRDFIESFESFNITSKYRDRLGALKIPEPRPILRVWIHVKIAPNAEHSKLSIVMHLQEPFVCTLVWSSVFGVGVIEDYLCGVCDVILSELVDAYLKKIKKLVQVTPNLVEKSPGGKKKKNVYVNPSVDQQNYH
jgi:hypothetical protein